MADEQTLADTLDSAFETAKGEAQDTGEEIVETETPESTETEETTVEAAPEDEETGDVLLDKLTPDQIAELKKDPRLKAIYKGLMSSYTPKMQQFAEQQRLWEALNNGETRQEAIAALARTVGLEVSKPQTTTEKEQAAEVADSLAEEWGKVVGPEAAQLLRPLIEKTALAAVQGTLRPLQQSTETLQMDARGRQAEAQVANFKALAEKNKWDITPEVEARMAELGQQLLPSKPIETVQQGVDHLTKLYRLATADTAEQMAEKRVLERMKKASQDAEPGRGVPSTGREKRTNVTRDMDLNKALDVAMEEEMAGGRSYTW